MAKRMSASNAGGTPRVRCAIYTRKSTEEGLDQAFNSLDAQREACAAYIASQRAEGWTLLPTHYDDGGFSGGNMERPALKALLADVAAGKVDTIVLYKVDRLTRSLADFAKIVDVLDAAGASFVSVTQSFNTTTSMGRLTLNMLLSFAQFEREVTGERIRDKVAASKRKGMFMGGLVPLGYDVHERKLVVNEAEAETIRLIYARYLALRSIGDLAEELERAGVRSKRRVGPDETITGGRVISKGALACMLKRRTYLGEVNHKGQSFPGEHQAIVDRDTFERVQALLADNGGTQRSGTRAASPSLLAGMLRDGEGRMMTPRHACKQGRRYRYYVTAPTGTNGRTPASGWSIPAGEIEQLVRERLAGWLVDAAAIGEACTDVGELPLLLSAAMALSGELAAMPIRAHRALLLELDAQVEVDAEQVTLSIGTAMLIKVLGGPADVQPRYPRSTITVPAALTRRGHELRLALAPGDRAAPAQVDARLVGLIAKGHAAHRRLASGETFAPNEKPHLVRLARLTSLAPDITTAILDGRQPVQLTARRLLRLPELPLAWTAQRVELGFV